MTPAAELNRRLGIEPRYAGQLGEPRRTPRATVEALWRALVPEAAGADAPAILAALDRAAQERVLPPVVVARAGPRLRLDLRRPAAVRGLRWQIAAEDGRLHRGEERAAALRPARRPDHAVLELAAALPPGYHRLTLRWTGRREGEESAPLILTPDRAFLPRCLAEGRAYGLAAQLYGLRSARNWGIGDFGDLGELLERAAAAGAAAVGVNPLHALFEDEPERASPYSPSSRLFLNPLYLDVTAVADFAECEPARALAASPAFAATLDRARAAGLVDYAAVAAVKRQALELLFSHFREHHLAAAGDARGAAFRDFQRRGGTALRRFALFQLLRERFRGGQAGWRSWPAAYRRPDSAAVRRAAAADPGQVELFEYLQWQADLQLAAAARRAGAAGMGIGIYRDLAVGFDPDGADAWTDPQAVALDWSVGAPPDAWNQKGQIWGLPPLDPRSLRARAYGPLIAVLRANMRHAGALRIDHALGLKRLFWIPQGGRAAEGGYVAYPFEEMLGIVALESQRHRCLVVGEDLGTVPDGFSEALQARGILSYRLLYFMRRQNGAFIRPAAWPRDALAQVSTHDLPTLKGFWLGRDIEVKRELGLFQDPAAEARETRSRPAALRRLAAALEREGLPAAAGDVPSEQVHRYLARCRSRLAMLQLEDLAGALDQINMPGTVGEYPNWRRKLPQETAALLDSAHVRKLLSAVARERAGEGPAEAPARRRPPKEPMRATYRLQLTSSFGFDQARAVLPYLADLGVSHVYVSPILEAQAGSTHGYDVTSYERLNPDLGPPGSFDQFCARLGELDLKLVVDFVPNHMGIGKARNRCWLDLLEWGAASPAAEIFDIDWDPPWPELRGKVLVPFLGEGLESVLARGEIELRFDRHAGCFDLWYAEHRFPLRPQDYADVIRSRLPDVSQSQGGAAIAALHRLAVDFGALAAAGAAARTRAADLKTALALLAAQSTTAARLLEEAASGLARAPGRGRATALQDLLARQHYLLADWRLAATRANYRRFFDISELMAVRMEQAAVFERCHAFIGRLIAEGRIQGLRLDHVDGLKDPAAYCRRLRRFVERRAGAGGRKPPGRFYLVAEKILGPAETLRDDWPVEGTTGYDYIALLDGLLVDPAGAAPLQRLLESFARRPFDFAAILRAAKGEVIDAAFAGDLERLARQVHGLAPARRSGAPELGDLRAALRQIAVCFPVYRSYVTARGAAPEDRRLIDGAVAEAARGTGGSKGGLYRFLGRCLKAEAPAGAARPRAVAEAAMRFQQFTAPVMAKGLEDTSFYRYARLLALNEVGGAPGNFGIAPAEAHRLLAERRRRWPRAMLATATHDTKRGEDSRARLAVLSEIPSAWGARVRRWARLNAGLGPRRGALRAPRREDEYFIYQTLVGVWPFEWLEPDPRRDTSALLERLKAYLVKALREAKQTTSWLNPNTDYEEACLGFLGRLFDGRVAAAFVEDLTAFVREIAAVGAANGLAQTVLKLTSPGVPDVYQGCELWDLSLVDPDNRRPVDFAARAAMLREAAALPELLANWRDGRIKLRLIAAILALRRREPALFIRGSYEPLAVRGPAAEHVFAYARRDGARRMLVAVGRLLATLPRSSDGWPGAAAWAGTELKLPRGCAGAYLDVITGQCVVTEGERLSLQRAFDPLPIAVLIDAA